MNRFSDLLNRLEFAVSSMEAVCCDLHSVSCRPDSTWQYHGIGGNFGRRRGWPGPPPGPVPSQAYRDGKLIAAAMQAMQAMQTIPMPSVRQAVQGQSHGPGGGRDIRQSAAATHADKSGPSQPQPQRQQQQQQQQQQHRGKHSGVQATPVGSANHTKGPAPKAQQSPPGEAPSQKPKRAAPLGLIAKNARRKADKQAKVAHRRRVEADAAADQARKAKRPDKAELERLAAEAKSIAEAAEAQAAMASAAAAAAEQAHAQQKAVVETRDQEKSVAGVAASQRGSLSGAEKDAGKGRGGADSDSDAEGGALQTPRGSARPAGAPNFAAVAAANLPKEHDKPPSAQLPHGGTPPPSSKEPGRPVTRSFARESQSLNPPPPKPPAPSGHPGAGNK